MKFERNPRASSSGASDPVKARLLGEAKELLTTKEVARLTALSPSYFEKGRVYGYGPKFIRIQAAGKTGKILYRRDAVEAWLAAQERDPEVLSDE